MRRRAVPRHGTADLLVQALNIVAGTVHNERIVSETAKNTQPIETNEKLNLLMTTARTAGYR